MFLATCPYIITNLFIPVCTTLLLSFLTNHQKHHAEQREYRNLPPAAAGGGAKQEQEQDESLAGDDEDDDDAPRSRSGFWFWSHRQPIIVPTKTHDGGMNENERQQLQLQQQEWQRESQHFQLRQETLWTMEPWVLGSSSLSFILLIKDTSNISNTPCCIPLLFPTTY
jgi:hypothetical protein